MGCVSSKNVEEAAVNGLLQPVQVRVASSVTGKVQPSPVAGQASKASGDPVYLDPSQHGNSPERPFGDSPGFRIKSEGVLQAAGCAALRKAGAISSSAFTNLSISS